LDAAVERGDLEEHFARLQCCAHLLQGCRMIVDRLVARVLRQLRVYHEQALLRGGARAL
jgi:hypothetical protein